MTDEKTGYKITITITDPENKEFCALGGYALDGSADEIRHTLFVMTHAITQSIENAGRSAIFLKTVLTGTKTI
jgi:hypothetical protein